MTRYSEKLVPREKQIERMSHFLSSSVPHCLPHSKIQQEKKIKFPVRVDFRTLVILMKSWFDSHNHKQRHRNHKNMYLPIVHYIELQDTPRKVVLSLAARYEVCYHTFDFFV